MIRVLFGLAIAGVTVAVAQRWPEHALMSGWIGATVADWWLDATRRGWRFECWRCGR